MGVAMPNSPRHGQLQSRSSTRDRGTAKSIGAPIVISFVRVLSSSARGVLGADLTAQVASTDSFVVRQLTVPSLGRTSVGTQVAFLPGLERRLWGTLP